MFNITGINESKILTKHTSCECKCKFDKRECNSNQWWNWNSINVDVSVKKHHICEKDQIWNPSTCICENEKYLASIMDDSVIMCDEVIEETVPANFNEKKATCKTKNLVTII